MDYKEQNKKDICDFIDKNPNCIFFVSNSGYAIINSENHRDELLKMAKVDENILELLSNQTEDDIKKLTKIAKINSFKRQIEELEKEL